VEKVLLCGTESGVTVAFVSSSHCCLVVQFWLHFKCTVNKKLLLTVSLQQTSRRLSSCWILTKG